MKRRNAIKSLSLGLGYTMTVAGMATFVSGCKQDGSITETAAAWKPSFLTTAQAENLEGILGLLLPKTEASPGFKDLNLIQVVDNVISKLYKKKDQELFSKGLAQLSTKLNEEKDLAAFMKKHMSKRGDSEQERISKILNSKGEGLSDHDLDDYHFYKFLASSRNIGISSYFSNEKIATEYLSYDPVPGLYNGCMPVEEVGNVWSL